MEYTDKTLQCRDCGGDFIFTAGEQEFYAEKGFTNEPGRCSDCRARRRRERAGGNREMHVAICAECGAETQVPFKPTTGKPIYCDECFSRR